MVKEKSLFDQLKIDYDDNKKKIIQMEQNQKEHKITEDKLIKITAD
jgi:hypothetical protein